MILNKWISIILSGCLWLLLMLVCSSAVLIFVPGGQVQVIGLVLVVVFYFVARAFYNYLRNDDYYKNTRRFSNDRDGEKYIVKGESDIKKSFLIVWIIVVLFISCVAMWLYSINNGLV